MSVRHFIQTLIVTKQKFRAKIWSKKGESQQIVIENYKLKKVDKHKEKETLETQSIQKTKDKMAVVSSRISITYQ